MLTSMARHVGFAWLAVMARVAGSHGSLARTLSSLEACNCHIQYEVVTELRDIFRAPDLLNIFHGKFTSFSQWMSRVTVCRMIKIFCDGVRWVRQLLQTNFASEKWEENKIFGWQKKPLNYNSWKKKKNSPPPPALLSFRLCKDFDWLASLLWHTITQLHALSY